ncbi:hypothetical protein [Saccharolobus islandicus]|uniref:hypothetical protein n=1 Tax=Saccharolobus islandicus TaxID=43080 RepID=UPI001389B75F|nr:hypothetical protein [Sulfolobus islandicus]
MEINVKTKLENHKEKVIPVNSLDDVSLYEIKGTRNTFITGTRRRTEAYLV